MKVEFEAFDQVGNLVAGEVEAASLDEARRLIAARGVTPYRVGVPGPRSFLLREIGPAVGRRPAPDKALARIVRDLAVLLQADVALDASLRIVASTSDDRSGRELARRLRDDVLKGLSLAEAMGRAGKTFRAEYLRIVEAGETGGDLGGALQELADLLDRRVEMRARLRGALAYPALLVALAAVSLWIVLGLLIPAVTPIFRDNGRPLPAVIEVLDGLRQQGDAIVVTLAGVAAAVAAGVTFARRNPALRIRIDRAVLALPVVGTLAALRDASRFTRTVATLLRAGVPLLQALETAVPLIANRFTRSCLDRAVAEVREGASLGDAVRASSALPAVALQMMTVGEETGRLQDMLLRAAAILDRQEQARTAQMLAVLTPAITILVAGMIAAVILSVMSAILSLNELVLS